MNNGPQIIKNANIIYDLVLQQKQKTLKKNFLTRMIRSRQIRFFFVDVEQKFRKKGKRKQHKSSITRT